MTEEMTLAGHSLELALTNKERLDLLKNTICSDLSTGQFEVFIEVCNRRKLDPFTRQIMAIVRKDGGEKKVVYQTGIDGFRVLAQRSGRYNGQLGPFWCGQDGVWTELWLADEPPFAARVGILRDGWEKPCWAVARWSAYVQTKAIWENNRPTGRHEVNSMWQRMGPEQLAKCAEALAIRKAFPEDLSGLYTPDELPDERETIGEVVTHAKVSAKDLDAELLSPSKPPVPPVASADPGKFDELRRAIGLMVSREERAAVKVALETAGLSDDAMQILSEDWTARLEVLKQRAADSETAAAHRKAKEDREQREPAEAVAPPNPDDDGRDSDGTIPEEAT